MASRIGAYMAGLSSVDMEATVTVDMLGRGTAAIVDSAVTGTVDMATLGMEWVGQTTGTSRHVTILN